jgi:hypothetical protein
LTITYPAACGPANAASPTLTASTIGIGMMESWRTLRKKAKAHPEKYVEIDCAAGCYQIDGREYVWDCPCNGGYKYQSFLLRHATRILAFLEAHAKRLEEETKELRPSAKLMATDSFPPVTPRADSPVGKRLITL